MKDLEDKEILRQICKGDEVALEHAFRQYAKPLHAYGYTLLNNSHVAEEMIQDLFLKIWEQRGRLQIHTSLKAYLYRCMHNDCMNHLRHLKVKRNYETVISKEQDRFKQQQPVNRLEVKEIQQKLRNGLNKLPEACRTVFQLSRFEHLSYKEIASQLGISTKTVENQMGKAFKILRLELQDYLVLLLLFIIITTIF